MCMGQDLTHREGGARTPKAGYTSNVVNINVRLSLQRYIKLRCLSGSVYTLYIRPS